MRRPLIDTLFALVLALLPLLSTQAALPADVQGQPLPSLAPMLERVTPAVVNIHSKTVERVRNPMADDPFFRQFFGLQAMPQERVRQSLGSGVIIDAEQGLVLTNNHVIEGADDISITLADGRTLEGTLVGADPDTDVALVRVPAERLTALPLAVEHDLRVGDFVVAVGNPFGLGQTVTSGIVSALGRAGLQGLGYQNFIQTDASINPGNSGGALVNLRGELVGINTAIFSPSGGNVGIGFAIPADMAAEVQRQLQAFGEVRRGSLGIDDELRELLGIATPRGVVVTRVRSESPAGKADVQVGDVLTALDGKPLLDPQSLHNIEGLLPVERPITVDIVRNGIAQQLQVVLTARARALEGGDLDPRLKGAAFAELPERVRRQGGNGVLVERVDAQSRAATNGLQAGDWITGLNRYAVDDLEALQQAAEQQPNRMVLSVVRGRRSGLVEMQ